MRASIIIPLYNQLGFTKVCLEYLVRNTPKEAVEIILVDNASSDGTKEFTEGLRQSCAVIRNEVNLGFAKACNQGARAATGDFLVFLNNDTAPHRNWLQGLLDPFERRSRMGITGPKLIYPDGTIQQSGVVFSGIGLPYHLYTGCAGELPGANRARFFRSVTGACFAITRQDFLYMEGFDERYLNGLEDIDLCLRVDRQGKGIYYNPASVVTHFESRSENRQARMDANAKLFTSTWGQGNRHDDFRYLNQDGMGLWVTPENRMEFISLEEMALRIKPEITKAEASAKQGDAPKALNHFREVLSRAPYSVDAMRRVSEFGQRLGLKDIATQFRAKAEAMSFDDAAYGSDQLPSLAEHAEAAKASVGLV